MSPWHHGRAVILLASLLLLYVPTAHAAASSGAMQVSAILGGARVDAADAVVALVHDGRPFCSGTLIGPLIVLTAAHCLPSSLADPQQYSVRFDTCALDVSREVSVSSLVIHPDFNRYTLEADVALLLLAEAPVATPIPLTDGARAGDWSHGRITLLGFGRSDAFESEPSCRSRLDELVTRVDAATFEYGAGTCYGDSGGPAVAEIDGVLQLVGVTSSGPRACQSSGRSTRVDTYRDWIDEAQLDLLGLTGCSSVRLGSPPTAVVITLLLLLCCYCVAPGHGPGAASERSRGR